MRRANPLHVGHRLVGGERQTGRGYFSPENKIDDAAESHEQTEDRRDAEDGGVGGAGFRPAVVVSFKSIQVLW